MTAIGSSSSGISIGNFVALDLSKLTAIKASPEMMAEMEETWKGQFKIPVGKADNDPSNIYATVKVNGKVVATLYNSGGAMTSNATGAQVSGLPSMGEGETLTGPALAQKRAEEIAKALGGTIETASTAQTAAEWRPAKVEWTYDYEAMNAARAAIDASLEASRQASSAAAQTKMDAQLIGQASQSV